MLKTYKTLSLLLDYPDEALVEALPQIKEGVEEENLLYFGLYSELEQFLAACSALSLGEWQMMYVGQFDCSKTVNLYLFDHIYGDSRERGQAMVDLKNMYARSGLELLPGELPDYLPLFLEYLSLAASPEKAAELLFDVKPVIRKIKEKLEAGGNIYFHLFVILDELAVSVSEETCV